MDHDEAIERLAQDVQRLRIDFERFLNGARATPPEDLRRRIQNEIRFLREANLRMAQRFRLGNLEGRFNAFSELYNRRQRDREEGREVGHHVATHHAGDAPGLDARNGVTVRGEPSTAATESLFSELYRDTKRGVRTDLEAFHAYLKDQVSRIREKTGCDEVQFRVVSEAGKLKLKAKPVR
jgi:hypothetical protein